MALPPPYMKAKKRFGQNFLVNDEIISSIVKAINPKVGQNLIEIGPGHAALTKPVLSLCKNLTAIELDRDLVALLRSDPFLQGLNIIEADALKFDFSTLKTSGKMRVFGNLPYNITSPLIFHLLLQDDIQDMHFMLQKEVVQRLAAAPNNKDYGRLSVMVQYFCEVIPLLEVPAHAFVPPPKVVSAVVRLIPKNLDAQAKALYPFLNEVTIQAFSARRKTIVNSLAKLFSKEDLSALNIDLSKRAENLKLEEFINLAKILASRSQS